MSQDPIPLICAEEVLSIPIEESGEPLVDLRESNILTATRHPRIGERGPGQFYCRREVARRLFYAQMNLREGMRLLVLECHRPVELQTRYWEEDLAALRKKHPEWSEAELYEANARFVAPPDDAPSHSTGGALDVTLADADGEELDMGSPVNAAGPQSYTHAEGIPAAGRRNRLILLDAMRRAGFVNYGYEWWHYSYGDRYWAYVQGEPAARYGAVEV